MSSTARRPWFAVPTEDVRVPSWTEGPMPTLPRDATGAWTPPGWAGAPFRDETPVEADGSVWAEAARRAPTERLAQITTLAQWAGHLQRMDDAPPWSADEVRWMATHPAEDVRVVLLLLLRRDATADAFTRWRPSAAPLVATQVLAPELEDRARAELEGVLVDGLASQTAAVLNAPDGPLWTWSAQLLQIEDGEGARRVQDWACGAFTVHPWLAVRMRSAAPDLGWFPDPRPQDAAARRLGGHADARSPGASEDVGALSWEQLPPQWDLTPWALRVRAWLTATPLPRLTRLALSWHSLSWPTILASAAGPVTVTDVDLCAEDGAYSLLDLAGNPWADARAIAAWWDLAIDTYGPQRMTQRLPVVAMAIAARRLAHDPRWHIPARAVARIHRRVGKVTGWILDNPLLSILAEQPNLEQHPRGWAVRDLVLEQLLRDGASTPTGTNRWLDGVTALVVPAPAGRAPGASWTNHEAWLWRLAQLPAAVRHERLREVLGREVPSWLYAGLARQSVDLVPGVVRALLTDVAPQQWPAELVSWCLKSPTRALRDLGVELLGRQGDERPIRASLDAEPSGDEARDDRSHETGYDGAQEPAPAESASAVPTAVLRQDTAGGAP